MIENKFLDLKVFKKVTKGFVRLLEGKNIRVIYVF